MKSRLLFVITAALFGIVASAPLRRAEVVGSASGGGSNFRSRHDAKVDAILTGNNPAGGEAVTVQTWVSLKEGMANIRNEVKHLLSIKDDISMLQDDLKTQENVWQKAEHDLSKENAALLAEVQELNAQLQPFDAMKKEIERLRLRIETEKRSTQDQRRHNDNEEQQEQLERQYFEQRRVNLTILIKNVSDADYVEIGRAHERQLQLETDTVALRVKDAEFQDRLKSGARKLTVQDEQASAKTVELKRQLVSMQDGLAKVRAELHDSGPVEQFSELAQVKLKIDKEIASMVAVKEEHAQVAAKCEQVREQRNDARCAEEQKAEQRQKEMQELCQPVHGQLQALQTMLDDCHAGATRGAAE